MEFLIIFGKFVTKNRAFGNNTIFYSFRFTIFRFRWGGGFPPSSPGYALDLSMCCTCSEPHDPNSPIAESLAYISQTSCVLLALCLDGGRGRRARASREGARGSQEDSYRTGHGLACTQTGTYTGRTSPSIHII